MFGYVVANGGGLTEGQLAQYRSCYCGLCRALGQRHGFFGRLTLNYDMTFLVLLLSSLYEPEERAGESRCAVHPAKKHPYHISTITDYAADMNVALAYQSALDNWKDEKKLSGLVMSLLLRPKWKKVSRAWPRQTAAISQALARLAALERENCQNPDLPANCFGELMGALFLWKPGDHWAPVLLSCGEALGRFIYVLDAVTDLPSDRKHGRYNPLTAGWGGAKGPDGYRDILTLLIGECTAAFEQLPLVANVDILRNILYSGVWTRLNMAEGKAGA